jgi:predicted enzyme related to lactoylglutathione lyase
MLAKRWHLRAVRRALPVFAAVGLIAAPAVASVRVPTIVTPASGEHHPGKAVFAELVTPDIGISKRFYGGVFGWQFVDVPGGNAPYAEAYDNGAAVAGVVQKPVPAGGHAQPAWLNFFSVADVDAAARSVAQAGGRVLVAPHDLADRGREAVLADPQGAVFAILASSSGDPPDVLVPPGDFIWRSLMTKDPAAAGAFYKSLFGYETFALPASPGQTHMLLASENYARASDNSMPVERPDMHPHWLAFVRVEGVRHTLEKITALGGKILVEPRVDRHGGLIAVVADPLGAPFGLMEWTADDSNQVSK